jgi:hypothetical protein
MSSHLPASWSRYADWKAPDEDGQFLIWPDPATLLEQTRENHGRMTSAEVIVQGLPLRELRARQRAWIGHREDQQFLIASGHQTELYHAGVWVKDVLCNALANHTGGSAYHFAVDTDSPKHLHLRWPGGGSMPITDDSALTSTPWASLLEGPTPAHVDQLESTFKEARLGWDFEPLVEGLFEVLRKQSLERPPLVKGLTDALHRLDWSLGLRHHAVMMSPVWMSEPYLVFAHDLMARPEALAGRYNAALAAYRREQGIASPGRPMPDLHVEADRVEAPFWLDDFGGPRRERLFLRRQRGAWALGEFVFDPSMDGDQAGQRLLTYLRQNNLRLAPRALTLTLFFRLLLADQFVHGIGGGRYDQVTDRLIAEHYRIEPPRFSVTTATLYFPGARGQRRISLRPLLQEGRRLRHGSFSREKRELATRIAALPRLSGERRELFYQMHAKLNQQAASPAMRAWSARLAEATREQMRQKALFDRELFYAMQPEERLREMIARYDSLVAAAS